MTFFSQALAIATGLVIADLVSIGLRYGIAIYQIKQREERQKQLVQDFTARLLNQYPTAPFVDEDGGTGSIN